MVAVLGAVAGFGAGCAHPAVRDSVRARAGIAIAIYTNEDTSYAVVDDRREVTLAGGMLELDDVDANASLASVVIEPLGDDGLVIGACHRDALVVPPSLASRGSPPPAPPPPSPTVAEVVVPLIRCGATGRSGPHRVRVLYVAPGLGFVAETDVAMTTPDRAVVATRYAVATPRRRGALADITLFAGSPGGESPPAVVAHGLAPLDGTTAIFAPPAREVAARLRFLLSVAADSDDYSPLGESPSLRGSDDSGGRVARTAARPTQLWLELAASVPAGALVAHVELAGDGARDAIVPAESVEHRARTTRAALWVDPTVLVTLERSPLRPTNRHVRSRTLITVANLGATPRSVLIEQTLPARADRVVESSWPDPPTLVSTAVRTELLVAPAGTARTRYVLATPAPDTVE